jgi:GTP cyclohydrolase II
MHEAERGLFDLRRGRPLYVTTSGGSSSAAGVLLATVDTLDRPTLNQLRGLNGGGIRLALTDHRIRAMGWPSESGRSMSVALNGENDPEQILRLSSGKGSYEGKAHDLRQASAPEVGGLTLARLGALLPAVVGVGADPAAAPALRHLLESKAVLTTSTDQIEALAANSRVELIYVSEGPVPLEEAETARFMCFREANGLLEHVAIVIGNRQNWPDPVPVRLHSACLTGDLFGSLRCDCGEQLRGSLRVFGANGGGILLYLSQEGRGIGLGNKLRAYCLQQEGLDTMDADGTLGFGADERQYDAAVGILRHLQVDRVQLLTNNPDKVRALREGGIQVLDRKPLYGRLNRHNVQYVAAKVHRAGHWLTEMLAGGTSR